VSVCVSLLSLLGKGSVKCISPFIARQRLGKHVPAATNTRDSRRLGRVCLWVCLCIPVSFLDNSSVKTFLLQRRIVGGVVFYAARVVSKESRRLVLPRTSCFIIWHFNICITSLLIERSCEKLSHIILHSWENRLLPLSTLKWIIRLHGIWWIKKMFVIHAFNFFGFLVNVTVQVEVCFLGVPCDIQDSWIVLQ
jgi:hypothetical protein